MSFSNELRDFLEDQERKTVGSAFGGTGRGGKKSYSVAAIRDWIIGLLPFGNLYQRSPEIEKALNQAHDLFERNALKIVISNLIRFSFLIELTNLKVGSTKMKTRWLPGLIQMPQEGSFEPVKGSFEPGNDPRASSFEECASIFVSACNQVCDKVEKNKRISDFLIILNSFRRVPYEFPFTYFDPTAEPLHTTDNVIWKVTKSLTWLLIARGVDFLIE